MKAIVDAEKFLADMREHKNCCGVPQMRALLREVGRLRTAFRVNMMRFGGTDAEIDRILNDEQG